MTPSPIFPWRYGMFLLLLLSAVPLMGLMPWHGAVMAGFDIAASAFLVAFLPLIGTDPQAMRRNAQANDANRELMLLLTGVVSLVVLVAVGVAVARHGRPDAGVIALVLVTLGLAWLFSNLVYAMHYAHIWYLAGADGKDQGGLDFPGVDEPGYWDFLYFGFTLGMTFQTSDVAVTGTPVHKTVLFHCLAAFVFNLGVIAFTINVLGGG